ncbi:890_t:CDS:2 [Racocetra persica]|uniref:890_t:CDS:1 n=1 Tax=Racocetra persica TaxID=160502 RepID=A0ACA9PXR4_9GLOM|nr:890_t:CDS:2 [Racocetra persica]
MSDDPISSTSIIQENFINNSSELPLDFEPDLSIVSKNTDTLLDSFFISENIEISESNFASVSEYTEQNQNFNFLNLDNYAKGPNHKKRNRFANNIDLTQFGLANDTIIESDSDNNALILIVYDIPAVRKISRFVGHSSKNRCYRYTKNFSTFSSNHPKSGKVNFSGFDQEFPHLSNIRHKQLSNNLLNKANREKKRIFDEYKIR